jgi:AraC-like DNA-binding protein
LLRPFIECYWIVENGETAVRREKIIPDGFPEMIFHYGDPYKINLMGVWEVQSLSLLAGQIRKHFFLENTGRSGMIGVKFFPSALKHLYDVSMIQLTDKVVDLHAVLPSIFDDMEYQLQKSRDFTDKIELLQSYFLDLIQSHTSPQTIVDQAIAMILDTQGVVSVSELMKRLNVSERTIERMFREYIGLSPKFYSRIIRFSSIFRLKNEGIASWTNLVYETGYFDQSHFIGNFKEFTGEDPSAYLFNNKTMANFFLKRVR